MRVKIEYVIDASDEIRRGIRLHYGESGLATRKEIQSWYSNVGDSMDGDLLLLAAQPEAFCSDCGSPHPVIASRAGGDGLICRACARKEIDTVISFKEEPNEQSAPRGQDE